MSRLTNVARIKNRSDVKTKEYGNQTYRSSLDFASQMRVATEKAKTYANPNLPESEMVRPYAAESYEEAEYNLVPEAGGTVMPIVEFADLGLSFDVDWDKPTVANVAFEGAWGEGEAVINTFINTYYSGSTADDGYVQGSSFFPISAQINIGGDGSPIFPSFFRFVDIDIPKGALIISAILKLNANSTESGNTGNTITCNSASNAVAPTSAVEYGLLAKTNGFVNQTTQNWTAGAWYDFADIKSEVQQVVDLVAWKPGNALMVLMTYYSGVSRRYARPYGYGVNPQLQVTWAVAI